MNAFAAYTFYTTTFGGSNIPQAVFSVLSLKASYEVDRQTLERASATITAGTDSALIEKIQLATCAVAEALYASSAASTVAPNVSSERVGDYSVNYSGSDVLQKSLANTVGMIVEQYLGLSGLMFRGVA